MMGFCFCRSTLLHDFPEVLDLAGGLSYQSAYGGRFARDCGLSPCLTQWGKSPSALIRPGARSLVDLGKVLQHDPANRGKSSRSCGGGIIWLFEQTEGLGESVQAATLPNSSICELSHVPHLLA